MYSQQPYQYPGSQPYSGTASQPYGATIIPPSGVQMGGVLPPAYAQGMTNAAAPSGFIPPAPQPTQRYVPPPRQPLKFELKPSFQSAYAQLYAILQTVEIIEDEWTNGNISNKEHDARLPSLLKHFNMAKSAAGFSEQNVRDFAEACNLECPMALNLLVPNKDTTSSSKSKGNLKDVREFAVAYVNLKNTIQLNRNTMEELRRAFNSFRFPLERLGVLQMDVKCGNKVKYWSEKFGQMHPEDSLSPSDFQTFSSDVDELYYIASSLN